MVVLLLQGPADGLDLAVASAFDVSIVGTVCEHMLLESLFVLLQLLPSLCVLRFVAISLCLHLTLEALDR